MITFYCGRCGAHVSAPDVAAGKTTRCDECDVRLPIPRKYSRRPQMRFFCPACEARVRAWADEAGEAMKCPNCEVLIDLPEIDDDFDSGVGVARRDEWLADEQDEEAPDVEPEEDFEVEPEAEEGADEASPGQQLRKRKQRRSILIACGCLLGLLIPIITIGALRAARPAWMSRGLLTASETGATTKARVLLFCGADVETEDGAGRRPLHAAAEKGHTKTAKLLLAYGAYVDPRDGAGRTPLLLAVLGSHKDIVRLLANEGADIELRAPDGHRLLDIAMTNGDSEIADMLLQKRREARQQADMSSTLYLPPGDEPRVPQGTKSSAAKPPGTTEKTSKPARRRYPVLPRIDGNRLVPLGYYMTYMVKIGIRRLWGAKGDVPKKFVIVIFGGPLDRFKVRDYEFRSLKLENPDLTSRELTRSFDPGRFTLILSNGRRVHASVLCPHWTPRESTKTSNIFYYDLSKSYKCHAEMRRGNVAVCWFLNADQCRPPFQVRIDLDDPMPVPDVRFDGVQE